MITILDCLEYICDYFFHLLVATDLLLNSNNVLLNSKDINGKTIFKIFIYVSVWFTLFARIVTLYIFLTSEKTNVNDTIISLPSKKNKKENHLKETPFQLKKSG